MTLSVHDLSVMRDGLPVLQRVSLDVATGEIVALTGRSGSGKSTLLMAIAGLIPVSGGEITWNGSSLLNIPTHLRGVGLVFQDRMLFPHLNVAKNVAFGLRNERSNTNIGLRVGALLEMVGLAGFEKRKVHTLSGGEAQRVALIRALAPRPRVLLLDEPMGALDPDIRSALTNDLRTVLRAEETTALHVTHDHDEASQLADRVVDLAELDKR
jgi:thiamine transport system ATP-binding protein